MKPAQFDYFAPATSAEAVDLLRQYAADEGKILAGGQSLVPLMNFRLARPKWLIDINGITELDGLRRDGEWLQIGAITRQRHVERSPLVAECCPILAEATRLIGHTTIRNRGTVGGCLAHNDPSAEYPLLAVLLDAYLEVRGPAGNRTVPAQDFFVTYLTTALQPDELLAGVRFHVMPGAAGWGFQEFARRHGDFAIAEVGAVLRLVDGRVQEARLAVGGAAPVAFRASRAEAILQGERLSDALIGRAAAEAAAMSEPDSDIHASAEYRRHLVSVLARRALRDAAARAGQSSSPEQA